MVLLFNCNYPELYNSLISLRPTNIHSAHIAALTFKELIFILDVFQIDLVLFDFFLQFAGVETETQRRVKCGQHCSELGFDILVHFDSPENEEGYVTEKDDEKEGKFRGIIQTHLSH